MNPDGRKRRFNEAIVNMLYPSPDSPPQPQREQELEPVEAAFIDDGSGSDIISDNLDDCDNNASTSGNEEHDDSETTEKLTRVQRKKIRKKKLNEEAIHRGKLIGPLLPPPMLQLLCHAQLCLGDDVAACAKSVKVKQRRMAKRLAKEKQNATTSENANQSSTVDIKETHL
ncbi:hypothetical protein GmHk_01G002528 [Glycine max]|nr:hypothetical protein GmHk_01G002528 [Glycine max]